METDSLKQRWDVLEGRKDSLHTRNEKYARWTLPYLYPTLGDKAKEHDTDLDSVGARAVNHLSNKLINTLFPSYRAFLRLEMSDDNKDSLKEAKVPMEVVNEALVRGEKRTMRQLDSMGHRTKATEAGKYLIVTGNALMYYPDGDKSKAQVYSTRDYCVVRDLSGEVIEIMTCDTKVFETFSDEVQEALRTAGKDKKYEDSTDVKLYTQIKLHDNGKFKIKQAADLIELNINENEYAKKDLPWVPLTWNLARGEDYGRGMVEEYRGAFGAIDVLSQALIEGVISAAALKFLVNPGSVVDVNELNSSENGSYHVGRDGDVVAVKSDKHLDFQQVREVLADYIRQIAQAFLLNSAVTRDAERVTAEEIREQAQELEMSYGGIYSRFTEEWQEPVAHLLLSRQNITVNNDTIYPVIVTGLDTLSRMGDLDNYRMFTQDLSMIAGLPESVQRYIKIPSIISWVGNNRGLDYTQFVMTEDERKAEDAALQQQQQEMMTAEAQNEAMVAGTKEITKQDI